MNAKKNEAIEKILANTANTFSKQALELKSIKEVEMIAKIAENSAVVPAVVPAVVEVDVDNAEVPVLGLPTLYAGQPDESTVTNEDVPTLGTTPLFTTKEK